MQGDQNINDYGLMLRKQLIIIRQISSMGNIPKTNINDQFLNEYREVRHEYGGVVLSHSQQQLSYFLKQYTYGDRKHYQSQLAKLNSKINHESVLNVIRVCTKEFNNFCSSGFKIYALFQYPSVTLDQQINSRKEYAKYFQQCQLWALLQSCVNALEVVDSVIGLHPRLIFIVNDGLIKMINNHMVTTEHRSKINSNIYYAPEKINNFHQADHQHSLDRQVMFSLGMSLLHSALLDNVYDCYDFEQGLFKPQIMTNHIISLANRYSKEFISTLTHLLEPNPQHRCSTQQVKEILNSFWSRSDEKNEDENQLLIKRIQTQIKAEPISTEKQNIFTDPKLLEMIRKDLEIMKENRKIQPIIEDKSHPETPIQSKAVKGNPEIKKSKESYMIYEYEDGRKYEGTMVNRIKHGHGKLTYPDGAYYEGEFFEGLMEGKGTLFYGPNQPAYIGQWMGDQFHGNGVLYNENPHPLDQGFDYSDFDGIEDYWVEYRGSFINDLKEGHGILVLSNGQKFEGEFSNDAINGNGTFMGRGGSKVKGRWESNLLIG